MQIKLHNIGIKLQQKPDKKKEAGTPKKVPTSQIVLCITDYPFRSLPDFRTQTHPPLSGWAYRFS